MPIPWCQCQDCMKEYYPRIDSDNTTYNCPYCGSSKVLLIKTELTLQPEIDAYQHSVQELF